MYIDKFTPEELKIIKQELLEPKSTNKKPVTKIRSRLLEIFPHKQNGSKEEDLLWLSRMGLQDNIYEIIDVTLKNVEYKPKRYKGEYKLALYRASFIPLELKEEYAEMAKEILDIIDKHKKE